MTGHRQLLEKIIIFRHTKDNQEYYAKYPLSIHVTNSENFLAEIVPIKKLTPGDIRETHVYKRYFIE